MTRLRRVLARGDRGVSLVETLVVMVLLTIVSTLVTRAVLDSHQVVRIVEDQTQGLADVRIASERLGRDIRQARSVVCNPVGTPAPVVAADPTCLFHLQLWVDENSDYVQQAVETVTWSLEASTRPNQFDLVRTVPPPGAAHTSVVSVNMTYDSNVRSGTQNKTVSFTGRLRNVS